MEESKVTRTIRVTPKFWEEWTEYAASAGMSASQMVEFMGWALLKSQKGVLNIMDMMFEAGVEVGKKRSKGRKK